MKKSNKTMKRIVSLGLIVGILASVGIGAYLTSTDVKEDVYTVGNVQAEIVAVGDMELANAGHILPNTTHQYERAAMNTGINDAYVFMTVTIPVVETYQSADDGTNSSIKDYIQLFAPEAISSEWKLVDTGILGMSSIWSVDMVGIDYAHDTHCVFHAEDGDPTAITYIYGYVGDNADGSLKALASGETTSNLFDELTVANFSNYRSFVDINGHSIITKGDIPTAGEVTTKLYAIQSENIDGGIADVNGVWAVVNNAINGFEKIDLVIDAGTTTIAMGAYMQRADIKSVTIPASVTEIDDGAFFECVNLKTINFEGTEEQWNAITFGEMWNYGVPADVVINFLG